MTPDETAQRIVEQIVRGIDDACEKGVACHYPIGVLIDGKWYLTAAAIPHLRTIPVKTIQ